jgi:hypothetical protein
MSQGKSKNSSHWDGSHPGEVARDKLRKAVKRGAIIKPTQCALCGNADSLIIGHHWRGYEYPYDVWWICPSCNTFKDLRHDGTQSIEQARAIMATIAPFRKSDNSHLTAKLDLRRRLLDTYHADGPIHVLDCCQGEGKIWAALKQEYAVTSYWGVDLKQKKGRLALDSRRILAQPVWPQNVIDVDTYGSPWEHWLAMLPNITKPTTIFLTIGDNGFTKMQHYSTGGQHINFPPSTPQCLRGKISPRVAPNILLTKANDLYTIAEATEAIADGAHARYIGVHLVPR